MIKTMHMYRYAMIVISIVTMLLSGGCSKDYYESNPVTAQSRLLLKMDDGPAVASVTAGDLVGDMRLFAFQKTGSVPFSHEIYTISRNDNTLQALMRTGNWDIVLVSPLGGTISTPVVSQSIMSQKMYEYIPTVTNGVSSNAPEIFYNRINNVPVIEADGEYAVNTAIARNVAMVKIFFEKAAGIDNAATGHTVKLYGVPSTLTWAGGLFPDKNNPDVLQAPLEGVFTFTQIAGEPGFSQSNEVVFIIPAHRGGDFWLPDGVSLNANPLDTTTAKMNLSVDLVYSDGSHFSAVNKEIPIVPRCNGIMEVKLKINKADVEISSDIKPWNREDVNGDLNIPFLGISTTELSTSPGNSFRIYFWTNQKTNISIEENGKAGDPVTGSSFAVNDVFNNLAGNGNLTFDANTGRGYFDVTVIQTIPGVTRYCIFLNANGLRRAIAINI